MKLIRNIPSLPDFSPRAIAIGAFDGIHQGHLAVINSLVELKKSENLICALMTFEPLPKEDLLSEALPRLTNFRERYGQIKNLNIDEYYCINFRKVRKINHVIFLKNILLQNLSVKYLFVGSDFKFGKDGKGDLDFLKIMSSELDYKVIEVDTLVDSEKKISSTHIRNTLIANDLNLAQQLLGRPYTMSGRVRKGQQLGRTLGYPTANIAVKRLKCALEGVYLVRANLEGITYNGIASIGTRPTLGGFPVELEVYLLDFCDDIYGKYLDVEFLDYISPQIKYDNLDQLIVKMNADEKKARALITRHGL